MFWALKQEQLLVGQDAEVNSGTGMTYKIILPPQFCLLLDTMSLTLSAAVLIAIWNAAVSQHCSTLCCHTTKRLNNLPQYLKQPEIICIRCMQE